MKKITALVLALCLIFALSACGKNDKYIGSGPHGTYSLNFLGKVSETLTFSGNEVVKEENGKTLKGSFVMEGDEVIIVYENGETTDFTYSKDEDILYHIYGGLTWAKDN